MEAVKVCRLCLITGVKMFDLQSDPLQHYFLTGIGVNTSSMSDLPLYACYECATLVNKYYNFREKCIRAQTVLYNVLHTKGQITVQNIGHIDRLSLQLKSNLNFSQCVNQSSIINYVRDDSAIENLKNEPAIEDFNEPKYNIEIDTIKEELDYDITSPPIVSSDDDDEPLSFHKSNKDKRSKKKAEKKKGKKKKELFLEELVEMGGEVVTEEIPKEETTDIQVPTENINKRKRGRPRKNEAKPPPAEKPRRTKNTGGVDADEIDLEEYVTVVKLSVEEQLEEINKRQQSSNYLNAPFQCNLCFKGFIDTHAWKHHVGKHDPSAGDIECSICKFRFKTKRTLQKHAANHEKKYACKSCPYVSKTTTQAKQHQRWHKGVTYKCQYCDEVSTKWTSYLSHVRIKHPSEFICGACGYSFVSKLGLNMHRTMMHKELVEKEADGSLAETGPYCGECDVRFVSTEAYKRHMVTSVKHTQTTDFKNGCRVCGETFSSAEEARLHHRRAHARKRPKNYGKKPSGLAWPANCEHCSVEIPNAREHWTHFRRVHPDKTYPIQKNYVCDICGKSFRGNAFLVYHKRTHTEERAFKCAQCPKAFFNRTNLQMHEKTHSDHRPYPCALCFKAFKCKGALDRHFRSHSGVKPYSCEVCGKAFGQSNSRKLHVRTVHLKQPAPYVSRARADRRPRPHHPAAPAAPSHPHKDQPYIY